MKPGPRPGCGRRWGGAEGPGVWNLRLPQFTHRGRWGDHGGWAVSRSRCGTHSPSGGGRGSGGGGQRKRKPGRAVSALQVGARSGHFTAMTEHLLCWFSWGGAHTVHLGCRACRILFPPPETEPGPNSVKHRVLTIGLPGKSHPSLCEGPYWMLGTQCTQERPGLKWGSRNPTQGWPGPLEPGS